MIKPKKDLSGSKFGKLLILEQAQDYIDDNGKHTLRYNGIGKLLKKHDSIGGILYEREIIGYAGP